jgi:hypothetical protein
MENNVYKVAEDFFNFDLPCPIEIENCVKLRKEYKKRVSFVETLGLCTPCEVTNIKNYYIIMFKELLGKTKP